MTTPTQANLAELERLALRIWRKTSAPGAECRIVVCVGAGGHSVTIEPALTRDKPDSPAANPSTEVAALAQRIQSRAARRA